MTDWIEAAADDICDHVSDLDLNRKWEGDLPPVPTVAEIADIIRRHAPPQPEWRERPTCPGRWDTDLGKCYWISEESLEHHQAKTGILWYGPIPPTNPRPEQPEWRERPTCAGLWICGEADGSCGFMSQNVNDPSFWDMKGMRWYGPIPPAQETK